MAVRKILTIGNDTLRKSSKAVHLFDKDLHVLLDDMKDTLYKANGIGLAAPQIGVLRRIVVVDVNGMYLELINPIILSSSGKQYEEEGCLSVPKFFDFVERPKVVTCKAQDRFGVEFTITGTDLLARCICHEIDHLDGKLFVDISKNGMKYFK